MILLTIKLVYRNCCLKSKNRLIRFYLIPLIFIILNIGLIIQWSSVGENAEENKEFDQSVFIEMHDDTKVSTANYVHDYTRLKDSYKTVVDQLKQATNKHKIEIKYERERRHLTRKDEYLIYEYTRVGGKEKNCQYFRDVQNVKDGVKDYQYAKNKLYLEQCPYKNCLFTCDKSDLSRSDVIMFHMGDLLGDMKKNQAYFQQLQSNIGHLRDRQIWLLYNDEANEANSVVDKFKFNWTMSYRVDAEVNDCAYGCYYSNTSKAYMPAAYSRAIDSNQMDELIQYEAKKFLVQIRHEFKVRKNEALWYVSNCGPKFRLNFARSLKTNYPLKVIGSCAKYISSKNENFLLHYVKNLFTFSKCERLLISKCESIEFRKFKFYLSFESKNCTGYMTEKVWRILRTGMIPVVIQPAKIFYELSLPPNSFIHAEDFDFDPVRLANHLIKVSNNFDLYYKYLEWKLNNSVTYSDPMVEKRRNCELCTKINTEKSVIYYESVSKWFNHMCFNN